MVLICGLANADGTIDNDVVIKEVQARISSQLQPPIYGGEIGSMKGIDEGTGKPCKLYGWGADNIASKYSLEERNEDHTMEFYTIDVLYTNIVQFKSDDTQVGVEGVQYYPFGLGWSKRVSLVIRFDQEKKVRSVYIRGDSFRRKCNF